MRYEFQPLIKIYRYSDADRGYGNAGTVTYVRVSRDEFDVEIHTRYDGSIYTKYIPTQELYERAKAAGYNYYSMGWEFATEEEYNDELTQLRAKLAQLESIN
jgi:hypothetical protein